MRVAGTVVEPAADDERERTILVSDLHVPREGGVVGENFAAVCALAREDARRSRLLVLGDLFEFFVNDRQLRLPGWEAVVDALRGAVDAGVSVSVLHGNRDFLLGRGFARRTGVRVVAGGLSLRLAGRSAIVLHGDEFCLNDVPYQRSKRWLRSRALRFVAHNLPLSMALRAGEKARQASGGPTGTPPSEAGVDRYAPVASAAQEAFRNGAELLVFGHIHRPARGRLEGGGEYIVMPAFDEDPVYLEADASGIRYRRIAEPTPLPDYPPGSFS